MTTPNPKSRREVKAMSDEELRRRIASFCGWTDFRDSGCYLFAKPTPDCLLRAKVPDYSEDLNAIHEAENRLSDELFGQFVDRLKAHYIEVTRGCTSDGAYSAPPRVRAECLVLTLTESQRGEE